MSVRNFADNLSYGQVGESLIARWLRGRGWSVLPVYDIEVQTGKGPRVFAPSGQWAAPDMLVYKANNALWIEAKHKNAFSWHRNTKQFTTGIDLRHYEHYCAIADQSPWPVWLLFLQRGGQAKDSPPSPPGLFGNKLGILRKKESHRSTKWGTSGMVYWALPTLRLLAGVDDNGMIIPA